VTDEIKESVELLLTNRNFIYSLLYKVFGREPDREMLDILTAQGTGEAFAILSTVEDDTLSRVPAFLGKVAEEAKDHNYMEGLNTEYTRLFIGPVKLVAPPWESIYRGKESMLFQESTLAVRGFYKSFGLKPEGYPHVADDSLPLELAFMSKLAERSLEALKSDNKEQLLFNLKGSLNFLDAHLLVWIPKFLECMVEAPSDMLYPQMSLVLSEFIKKDKEVLEEIIAAL